MNGNNSHRIVWYLVGVLTAMVLSLVSAWALNMTVEVKGNAQRIAENERRYIEEVTKINTKLDGLIEEVRGDNTPSKRSK